MLKRDITYETFGGEGDELREVTQTFYFHLAKHEMVELEAEKKGGFTAWMQDILAMEDNKTIMEQFKRIILMTVGEKSPDGSQFIKNQEIRDRFESHAAYHKLYWMMISDEAFAAEFMIGVLPADVQEMVRRDTQAAAALKASGGTPTPPADPPAAAPTPPAAPAAPPTPPLPPTAPTS